MRVFSTGELSEFVTITAAMRVEKVEDIYRRAWDLLSLPASASHGQAPAQAAPQQEAQEPVAVGQQLTVPQLVQRRVIARAAQDGGDVAMTTTQVEHAQPEALRGAPPSAYSQEDRAFYTFWYGHMLNDLMQPPLAGVSHATARYIWDAAIAHAAAPAQAADSVLEDAHALLQEVAACFTCDDDLPDNLLPRIDAVLAARKQGGA